MPANAAALAASVRYVRDTCVPEGRLAEAAGVSADRLEDLRRADCVPEPTYRVFDAAVVSPIGALGDAGVPSDGAAYYSAPVLWWLRRAAEMQAGRAADLKPRLQAWLADDLIRALRRAPGEAAAHGWGHLIAPDGTIDAPALAAATDTLWREWMLGGWAVCLRRFDGAHLVAKEVERQRIARITDDGRGDPAALEAEERLDLLDAVGRLDAVLLPFAPHERPTGTPGRFIDAVVERYRLWKM